MDLAWGEHFWREDVSHSVHHEGCFSGLLRIHRRVGRKRKLHEGVREREGDSRRGYQARDIATGAVTGPVNVNRCYQATYSEERGKEICSTAKLVFGLNQSLDGYGDHQKLGPPVPGLTLPPIFL